MNNINKCDTTINLMNWEEPVKDSVTNTIEDIIAKKVKNILAGDYKYSIAILDIMVNAHMKHAEVQHG